jgi:hypothetical protein
MKYLIVTILILSSIVSCKNKTSEPDNKEPNKEIKKKSLSPHESAMAMIGDAHVHIDYSSPGVRGRKIFGELIPFGELWRAGANSATSLETNKDLIIDEKLLPAGKYAIFMIPNQENWTLIFNTRWDVHGTDKYQENEDVLRIEVIPSATSETQEHLKYNVEKVNDSSGIISMSWANSKVQFPFKLK